jgi:hypothetical protein
VVVHVDQARHRVSAGVKGFRAARFAGDEAPIGDVEVSLDIVGQRNRAHMRRSRGYALS